MPPDTPPYSRPSFPTGTKPKLSNNFLRENKRDQVFTKKNDKVTANIETQAAHDAKDEPDETKSIRTEGG